MFLTGVQKPLINRLRALYRARSYIITRPLWTLLVALCLFFSLTAYGCAREDGADAWEKNTGVIELGDTVKVEGRGVAVRENAVEITRGGVYTLHGTAQNAKITISADEPVRLKLQGITLSRSDGPALQKSGSGALYLYAEENTQNMLSDGPGNQEKGALRAAVYAEGEVVLEGEGTLELMGVKKHALSAADVRIASGVLKMRAENDCVHASGSITLSGGSLELDGARCLKSEGDIRFEGGSHAFSARGTAVAAGGNVTVQGGNIYINEAGKEGIESQGSIAISGGRVETRTGDDGLNAIASLSITGGEVRCVSAHNDGIDSNGPITISGGYVVAMGAALPECGIDCNDEPLAVTGGTLIAVGGSNTLPSSLKSTQISLAVTLKEATEAFSLKGEGGELLAFRAEQPFTSVLVSMPDFKRGALYAFEFGFLEAGSFKSSGHAVEIVPGSVVESKTA